MIPSTVFQFCRSLDGGQALKCKTARSSLASMHKLYRQLTVYPEIHHVRNCRPEWDLDRQLRQSWPWQCRRLIFHCNVEDMDLCRYVQSKVYLSNKRRMRCLNLGPSSAIDACTFKDSVTTFSEGAFRASSKAGSSRSMLSMTCMSEHSARVVVYF